MALASHFRYDRFYSWIERSPRTADMKFIYDKVVHVRYQRVRGQGGRGGELRITMEQASEKHGSFNLDLTETIESSHDVGVGGSFGVRSRSLSLDVKTSGTQVTVVVKFFAGSVAVISGTAPKER